MTDFVPAANGSIVFMEAAGPNTNSGALWLMRPGGSTVELDSSPTDFDPSISYDGSKVVFARGEPADWSSDHWAYDLYVIKPDGTRLRRCSSSTIARSISRARLRTERGTQSSERSSSMIDPLMRAIA